MELHPIIVSSTCLQEPEREALLQLHMRHFANVQRERFMNDLNEKDWVILLFRRDGVVVGFSTQKLISCRVGDRDVRFLFSGDTVVDRSYWNTPLLPGCFGHLMQRLMERYGEHDFYWFLISKGFRTYRFLPVFFNRFWPAPDRATPPEMDALLAAVADSKFGAAFDPSSGLVRIPGGDCLVPDLAEVPDARLHDPHVAFFLARNPRYAQGEELACLAPIRHDNLNHYAYRVIRSTKPEWKC